MTSDPNELMRTRAPAPEGPVRRAPRWTVSLMRALRLRCPQCGDASFHQRWFRVPAECSVCGLERDRGEPDFFLGAMLVNLIVAEAVFAVVVGGWILLTLPAPPWRAIFASGAVLMILAPIVFYPFTKILWLAVDLIFRPDRGDTLTDDRPIRPPRPTG